MKKSVGILVALVTLFTVSGYGQSPVTKLTVKNETYYITTIVPGYAINGLYNYESKGEPIVQLNADGSGLFQLHEMSKTPMTWGIECDANGVPKVQKTDWGGIYNLWYQIKEKHQGKSWQSGIVGEWDVVSYSIHTDTHKMYVLGERVKTF